MRWKGDGSIWLWNKIRAYIEVKNEKLAETKTGWIKEGNFFIFSFVSAFFVDTSWAHCSGFDKLEDTILLPLKIIATLLLRP